MNKKVKEILDQGIEASKKIAVKAGARAQDLGEKGYKASKDFVNKAGEKAQDLGEQGMLFLDIKQLETQKKKLVAKLGEGVFSAFFEEGKKSVSVDSPALKSVLQEIESVAATIAKREAELKERKS